MGRIRFSLVSGDVKPPPYLLTFPSGLPSDLNSMRFTTKSESNRIQITSERGHQDYDGSLPKSSFSQRFAIAVFDSSSNRIEAAPALTDSVVSMKRRCRDVDNTDSADRNVASHAETKKMLIDDFGSKKRKRTLKAQEMNQVDIVKAGSAGALQHAFNSAAGLHESGKSNEAAPRPFLPPYNASTTDRNLIYPIDQLIPAALLANINIKGLSSRLKSQKFSHEGPADDQFSFTLNRLQNLRQSESSRDAVRDQLRQLALLSIMIHLYLQNNSMFDSASQLASSLGCNDDIADYLLSNFRQAKTLPSGKVVYTATASHRVKLLCHICVMSLIVSEFSLSKPVFDSLCHDLKLNDDLLYTHFHQIGATVKRRCTTASQTMISLSAPLNLPAQSSGFKRTRK